MITQKVKNEFGSNFQGRRDLSELRVCCWLDGDLDGRPDSGPDFGFFTIAR